MNSLHESKSSNSFSMPVTRALCFTALNLVLILIFSNASNALAKDPVFTTIDVPGATATQLTGVNSHDDIVGIHFAPTTGQHGFLLSNGAVTEIDVTRLTFPAGINSEGAIVGYYFSTVGVRGFVLNKGVFTPITAPGGFPPPSTNALAIDSHGNVVGSWGTLAIHGFLLLQGAFISIDVPGAVSTTACGINPIGEIVGYYTDATGSQHGFLLINGAFTFIDVPGASSTVPCGINSGGNIVGYYVNADSSVHGFLLSNGQFTTIDFPGASSTSATGITSQGDIVGSYRDATGLHGFLLSKSPSKGH